MARSDDDTWDINESVGATALGVAGGRAAETNSADPLINDPFAQLFLDAAGDSIWRMYQDGELPSEMVDLDPQFADRMQAMLGYTACRTKFFDEYFLVSADDGIRQSVILAAGLDARGDSTGLLAAWSTRSTSPKCWRSKPPLWNHIRPPRSRPTSVSALICARTGQQRWWSVGLTRRPRRRGRRRDCCPI